MSAALSDIGSSSRPGSRPPDLLDTWRTVETPEGVELSLRLSGPVVRMLAWIIDTLIRLGLYIVLAFALLGKGDLGKGLYLILLFVIEWFYPVLFELFYDGRTPGKRALGIRVVHDDGTPVGWSASVVRNLLRFVDWLPLFYVLGFVSMVLNSEFRRLGDIVAGTVVVYTDQPGSKQTAEKAEPLADDVTALAPRYALQADEAQAVVGFAERLPQFGTERADELARSSGALVADDSAPSRTLAGIARWIVGR